MSLLRSLYDFFITRPGGAILLLVIDVVLLSGAMVATAFLRRAVYGSLSLGIDLVMGFIIGFTILVGLNSLIYIGSLREEPSRENRS